MNKRKHPTSLLKIFISYIRKRESLDYLPIKLWIETTGRCNLKCWSCFNRNLHPDSKTDMNFDLFKDIIDQAEGYVRDINLFHRGEPLLHPRIPDMISYASLKGIKTRIHTNATLLHKNLAREIIIAGLDHISFSFDTLNKEDYEKKRIGADYDNTLFNIRQFLKIKKQMGRKRLTTTLLLMANSSRETTELLKQKYEMFNIFKDTPPDRILVRKSHNWGGLLHSGKYPEKYGTGKQTCTFPWYSLTIFSDGTVYPCPQDFLGAMPIGDLKKQLLPDIFNGIPERSIRKMFSSGIIDKKLPCLKCDRIIRKTFMGIPVEYAGGFLRDNL